MNGSRFADFHVLQSMPASNLNRDEEGEPKTVQIGGVTRAFGSSASWKRPLRLAIEDELREPAARTRMVPLVVADRLRAAGWPAELAGFAAEQITLSAKKGGLKTNPAQGHRTQAMLYLPADVPDRLAELCRTHRTALEQALDKQTTTRKTAATPVLPTEEIAAQLTRRTASISLLGRMLAELPTGHVEGAVQMAPAFTVHEANNQPDFFTTVEDWPRPNEAGSAHMQTAFLTAGLFYRFATVNVTDLIANLDGDTAAAGKLLELFAWSFIMAMPQGKKTSTAPHTVPDLVHYVVRDRRPVSYSAAFERPVTARGQGYAAPARQALTDYAATIDQLVGTRHRIAHGYATTVASESGSETLGTRHRGFEDLALAVARAALTAPDTDAARDAASAGAGA